ncbi:helix-turn-helix domain-containing protein [Deinococcus peraridilitoris]|uniref:Putative transcription factor, MBF1 like protein n=1 Tax=Deinococcus peraridilitoris (strain DSM 19664 / LMG 22246 / CIP 109416 / KR-200) TaxID=937777 RepID=L0A426_DEIPD|nr:XRE family transcriptional regulator [Deinococcus peraridilitoris]AFZ67952.1 putative transcription factor, MBF1 like protein [Deinococcus peraridilitoris DSM 19664]
MAILVDETGALIARRVRLEREARRWSQADLAERAAVSKATVSKIERQEMSPTAVVLVKLAGAFDLTLAGLLLRAEGQGERLTRSAGQPLWRDPATGYLRRQVFMRPDHPVEIAQIELPAGQQVVLPASSYAHIRQVIWVQAGELVIREGHQCARLRVGDCLAFGAPSEVSLTNESAAACTYLVVLARG